MSLPLEHWSHVKALFDEALQHPPTERAAWLDTACEDRDLRAEVERLLVAEAGADTFFGDLGRAVLGDETGAYAPRAGATASDAPPFERAGPYRLLRLVGQGGMGAVYLAERADGAFQRQVAVKLIRRGVTSEEAAVRFRVERQALAALRHPSIARLLDGGVLADGMPYLAMEYVEGTPITDYCDQRGLGVEARLRLFLEVCAAVEHAHRRLVIHRDLKPSNVLVAEDDAGRPRPVLLDFGLAKLLDAEPGVTVPLTQAGHHILTPHYAAPEQFAGGEITTATDTYALGVLLYELLSGHRPFAAEERGLQAIADAVRDRTPARPSAVVTQPEDRREAGGETRTVTPEDIGEARTSTPRRLQQRLRGDLDRIVLKALRKAPEQRYVSAEALGEDIRRHLGGLPVTARPQTLGYRTRTFVRRHRVGVAATVLVLVSLVGGLGAALWQADRAETEAVRARAEAERAEGVTQFMVDLFASADMSEVDGGATTASEMLGLGVERAETELAHRPETQAQVFNVVGNIYAMQGRYDEAVRLSERALDLRQSLYGEGDLSVAESKSNLGSLLFYQREVERAEPLLREALAVRARHLGAQDSATVESRNNLGLLLWRKGSLEEARTLLEQASSGMAVLYGDTSSLYAQTLSNLGLVYRDLEDFARAEATYREALRVYERTLGLAHPNAAITQMNLAKALGDQDDYAGAETSIRASVATLTAVMPDHPATLAARNYLGQVLTEQNRFEEAEEVLLQNHADAAERYGPDGQSTLSTAAVLASLYDAWGRPEQAAAFRGTG